jgi:hypothetical protein
MPGFEMTTRGTGNWQPTTLNSQLSTHNPQLLFPDAGSEVGLARVSKRVFPSRGTEKGQTIHFIFVFFQGKI